MKVGPDSDGGGKPVLNLTPTIDVVFLLLIFFIATIRLPKPEANLEAFLPKKDTSARGGKGESDEAEDINKIRVALRGNAAGELAISLNGSRLPGGFDRLDGALASLHKVAEQVPDAKTEIVLDAGGDVPYVHVVTTIDLCAKHEFNNVSFVMPPRGR
jgi:biopolymer transport protein ExbD